MNKKQKTDQEPAQPIVPNLAEVEIQLDNADLSSEPTVALRMLFPFSPIDLSHTLESWCLDAYASAIESR